MMLLICGERDIVHSEKDLFFGFTFSKMEPMVYFANEFEQYCTKEGCLDYRNILALLCVVNEVFHRKLEQDHRILVQELIEEKIRRFDRSSFLENYPMIFQHIVQSLVLHRDLVLVGASMVEVYSFTIGG